MFFTFLLIVSLFFTFFVKQISWQKLVESVKMSKFQLGRDSLNDRSLYDQRI